MGNDGDVWWLVCSDVLLVVMRCSDGEVMV